MNEKLKNKILYKLIKELTIQDLFDLKDYIDFELMKRGF